MEERTPEIAMEYLEHYKKVKYGMMPEWVWNMAIKALEQESKTGNWIEMDLDMYACSNCSHCFSIVPEDNSIKQYHYCPNCGASMVESQESKDKE